MASTPKLPADPFAELEESRLQRNIDAIDRQKKERGISWAEHLAGSAVLFRLADYAENPLYITHIEGLERIQPWVEKAERAHSLDEGLKREVVRRIQDTLAISRVLLTVDINAIEEFK